MVRVRGRADPSRPGAKSRQRALSGRTDRGASATYRGGARPVVSKIPWWSPQIGPHELGLVKEVLESGYINEGEVTARFEQQIADRIGAKHAVATTSGTTAIYLALAARGI